MKNAPKRIWFTRVWGNIVPNSHRRSDEDTEYVRADIHAAEYRKGFDDGCAHIKEDYNAGERIEIRAELAKAYAEGLECAAKVIVPDKSRHYCTNDEAFYTEGSEAKAQSIRALPNKYEVKK